ncbi:MAG TPA: GxxExxY protein [Rhodanobacteraceae bacterium]|jgi:GxxExxY protein|nr:GxxExxY protein [Rhodanobacteraceae bacterium]
MGKRLSERVIGCAVTVSRELGHGFLEKVYEEALALELNEARIAYERQKHLVVRYRDLAVGEYCCDFVVDGRLLLELKALSALSSVHEAQVMNYLKATGLPVGLLLSFGTSTLGVRRLVHNYDADQPI